MIMQAVGEDGSNALRSAGNGRSLRGLQCLMSNRGVSLVELLVVMAIVGMVATMSLPAVNRARSSVGFASDVRLLKAELHAARQSALSSRSPVVVKIILVTPGFTGPGHQAPVYLSYVDQVVVRAPVGEDGEGEIRFWPDGSSSGAEILLKSATSSRLVTVDWLTGAVSSGEGS